MGGLTERSGLAEPGRDLALRTGTEAVPARIWVDGASSPN